MRASSIIVVCLLTIGCQSVPQSPDAIADLKSEIESLRVAVAQNGESESEIRMLQASSQVQQSLDELVLSVYQLDDRVANNCKPQPKVEPIVAECEPEPRRVAVRDDKIVVGEVENVWVDPPGFKISARIDTGATSSSVHAENITEFERDGNNWVRFDISHEDLSVTIEREVEKYVRVYQQSDKEGTVRPVVALRVFLGDLQDTFEFTLADRAHLEHVMILGRSFLKDVALVDVAQEYVQPIHQPRER